MLRVPKNYNIEGESHEIESFSVMSILLPCSAIVRQTPSVHGNASLPVSCLSVLQAECLDGALHTMEGLWAGMEKQIQLYKKNKKKKDKKPSCYFVSTKIKYLRTEF